MVERAQSASLSPALLRRAEEIRAIQGALLDAYVILDLDHQIAAFNRPFFVLFPRKLARKLEGQRLGDVLTFRFGDEPLDPAQACLEKGGAVRFDEIEGIGPEGGLRWHFIVSATALKDKDKDEVIGALIILRDVTDEVKIQGKYQSMVSEAAGARTSLDEQLKARTMELLEVHDELNSLQVELMQYAKGLRLPSPHRLVPGEGEE